MKTLVVTKINNFVRKRLIELSGFLLILLSIFLCASIISYSPSDPNFFYLVENEEIKNLGGYYGSVISDFLLQSIGLVSFLFVISKDPLFDTFLSGINLSEFGFGVS